MYFCRCVWLRCAAAGQDTYLDTYGPMWFPCPPSLALHLGTASPCPILFIIMFAIYGDFPQPCLLERYHRVYLIWGEGICWIINLDGHGRYATYIALGMSAKNSGWAWAHCAQGWP